MTNYERIQQDKAFCASAISNDEEYMTFKDAMEWLDMEQREVIDEREQDAGKGEAE